MLESIALGFLGAALGETKIGKATTNLGFACADLGLTLATAPISAALDGMNPNTNTSSARPKRTYSKSSGATYIRNGFHIWKDTAGNVTQLFMYNDFEEVAKKQLRENETIDRAFNQFGHITEGPLKVIVKRTQGYMPTMTIQVPKDTRPDLITAYKARAVGLRLLYPNVNAGTYNIQAHNLVEGNMFAALMMIPNIRALRRAMRGINNQNAAIEHAARILNVPKPLIEMRLNPPKKFYR